VPHPDFGRVGILHGGGGFAQGLPGAIHHRAIRKVLRKRFGIEQPFCSIGVSVGIFNSWDENSADIFTKYFDNTTSVYKWSSVVEEPIERILKSIPSPLFRHHESAREWWRDWSNYRKTRYKNRKEFFADMTCKLSVAYRCRNFIALAVGSFSFAGRTCIGGGIVNFRTEKLRA